METDKNSKIIIALLTILIIIILTLGIYFMFIKNDEDDNVIDNEQQNNTQVNDNDQENVTADIIGKYVNNEYAEDYFILNADGTAEATYNPGCSECGDVKDYFSKNELTYKLTYNNDNSVTLEFIPLDNNYQNFFNSYIGKIVNGVYEFDITEPTPVANPGETKYIKQ